jgi:hypothetical protein
MLEDNNMFYITSLDASPQVTYKGLNTRRLLNFEIQVQ